MPKIGLKHTSSLKVGPADTAVSMGSGNMEVWATPSMVALMENAAMLAVAGHLPEGFTTVGCSMDVSHLRPTKMGDTVSATAEVTAVEGRKITFRVTASDGEKTLGEGTHVRAVVEKAVFLNKLKGTDNT